MGEKQGLSDNSLADVLTEVGCAYYGDGKKVWRRKDIEGLCFNKLHTQIQEEHLELLMNLNIFKKKDKWIYIYNTNVFFVIFLYQFFYKKNRNRERDYQQFFFDKQEEIEDSVIRLGLQIYCEKPQIILSSFLKMDEENFKKYVVVKWARKFMEDNYAVEYDKLIRNLIDTLDVTIKIDKEDNWGENILAWYDIFEIIELDKNFYLGEILPAEFTKEQRDILLQANLSNEVSLQQLYELNLLRTTGIESKLMKLWKIILEYVEEEKDE